MSLTYDGFDLTRYALVKLERPVGPSLRIETEQVSGRNGDIPTSFELETLTITAHCTLRRRYYYEWERVRMELAAAFSKMGERVLTLPDEPGLYRMATASLTANVTTPLEPPITFDVEFVCHDPVAYGIERSVTIPADGYVVFDIGGILPVGVRIEADAAVRDTSTERWAVRFDDSSFLAVKLASNTARKIEIDSTTRTVMVANAVDMVTLDSTWPKLGPGLHAARRYLGTGTATISWIERYL